MSRNEVISSGSYVPFVDQDSAANVPRSVFTGLSHTRTTTMNFAELRCVFCEETIPGDEFKLSVESLVRAMPMVVPPMQKMRLHINFFWQAKRHAWHLFEPLLTRGRDGQFVANPPSVGNFVAIQGMYNQSDDEWSVPFGPDSLWCDFGLPPMRVSEVNGLASYSFFVDATPFYLYQRIFRDYIMDSNINRGNRAWFPLDDHDFSLDIPGSDSHFNNVFMANVDNAGFEHEFPDSSQRLSPVMDKGIPLWKRRYANWRNDYFTGSSPFLTRSQIPEIEIGANSHVNFDLPYNSPTESQLVNWPAGLGYVSSSGNSFFQGLTFPGAHGDSRVTPSAAAEMVNRMLSENNTISATTGVTADSLRTLFAVQLWLEKVARTDGSYNQFIKTFFNSWPNAEDSRPVFVGGTYQDIVISEVLQTSESSSGSPLGTGAGHGISLSGGNITNNFRCNDFGWLMGIAYIMPEAMYSNHVPRKFTRETWADYYNPQFLGLSPQAILNQEVYFKPSDPDWNQDVFSYTGRYDELRFSYDSLGGKLLDTDDEYWKAWTMSRIFNDSVNFNNRFKSGYKTVRMDSFVNHDEPPFVVQIGFNVRAVRPISFISMPAGL